MLKLNKEFLTFIRLLNENQVEYILIGGYAVNFHGYARPTGDLDIWVNPTDGNRKKLASAVEQFHYNAAKLLELDFTKPVAFQIGEPPLQIDVLNKISGVQFSEALAKKIVFTLDSVPINIIHIEDLKINKFTSGRHRDLDDLENLPQT